MATTRNSGYGGGLGGGTPTGGGSDYGINKGRAILTVLALACVFGFFGFLFVWFGCRIEPPSGHFAVLIRKDGVDVPARPLRFDAAKPWPSGITLENCHAAALEHTHDVFRLYYYGAEAKGVFRGNDLLVCESIPVEDEWDKFRGLLIFNENAYEDAVNDWNRYWQWRANRNEARWAGKTGELFEYDSKNLMHCMRLLWSGENLLRHGFPIVRFDGPRLERLKLIRAGVLPYEEIMAEVEAKMEELKTIEKTSPLPASANANRIDELYLEAVGYAS